jgi:hypothetical protein
MEIAGGDMDRQSEAGVFKREQLYDLVWAEPVRTVARRYGISDVGLAKACRKLKIPLPRRGHWAKVVAGHTVKRARLPALREGEPTEYRIERVAQVGGTVSAELDEKLSRELRPDAAIVVSDELASPHALVASTASVLKRAKLDGVKRVSSGEPGCLDVVVSPALVIRACRIMDALIKALEARGYPVEVLPSRDKAHTPHGGQAWSEKLPAMTRVRIGEDFVPFGIFEELKHSFPPPKRPDSSDFKTYMQWSRLPQPSKIPSGRLTLTMKYERNAGRKSWTDDKPKRLEGCLNTFVRALIRTAEIVRRRRLEQEAAEKRWQEEARRRRRNEKAEQKYSRRSQRLEEELSGWRAAAEIRAYVAHTRDLLAKTSPATTRLEPWLRWALRRADALDPLADFRGSPSP